MVVATLFMVVTIGFAQNSIAAEFTAAPFGQPQVEILPVDDAFSLQVLRQADRVEVLWQIRPGHYLYKHSLAVKGSDRLGEPLIPKGLEKQDEYFGDVEVYYDALIVETALKGDAEEEITIQYQGCSDAGICYPPQKRTITL